MHSSCVALPPARGDDCFVCPSRAGAAFCLDQRQAHLEAQEMFVQHQRPSWNSKRVWDLSAAFSWDRSLSLGPSPPLTEEGCWVLILLNFSRLRTLVPFFYLY